jgi:hypothetical protein
VYSGPYRIALNATSALIFEVLRHSPRIPDRDWAAIRVFVLDAVAAASVTTTLDSHRTLKIAAPFVQWAVNLQGLPHVTGTVFKRRVIDQEAPT